MKLILLFHAILIASAPGQSFSDFRSGAAAVSFAIENGGESLSRAQQDDFLLYSTFMRGFLHGLQGSSNVLAQPDPKQLLKPDEWMLNPGKSAPSFLAFVAKHQPPQFDESGVDTDGLKSILVSWYLDSHSKTKDADGKLLAAKSLQIAFKMAIPKKNEPGLYISREQGFIAKFPAEVEVANMENVSGPLTGFVSADEDKLLIYQINIHDVIANRELKSPSDDVIRRLVKANFDAYCKESEALNVEWQWSDASEWPAIEFSCSHKGIFGEGVTSYKKGYAFLRGSKYYKVTIQGLAANKVLEDATLRFYSSLSFPDAATLKAAE